MSASYNLALDALALQSSYSEYSAPDDPLGAVSGTTTGSYGFHTAFEDSPWWMLDLGESSEIERIAVYNRCDAAPDRARHLTISVRGEHDLAWREIYRAENVFGGVTDSAPLIIRFGAQPITTRFLRLKLVGPGILHLDEIEVFGTGQSTRYRDGIAATISRIARFSETGRYPVLDRQPGAIVVLTRGYDDLAGYDLLIRRNRAIYESINAKRATHYPVLVFHEGNIHPSHQEYILQYERNENLQFRDVSNVFRLPAELNPGNFNEGWSLGYRLMCRFHAWDLWSMVSEYDYVLRVDEDCIIETLDADPFVWACNNSIDYAPSAFVEENHDLTNESLPYFIREFLKFKGCATLAGDVYNRRFPYTNVGLARPGFFLAEKVREFLRCVTSEPDFYRNRWGDLPVLGCALNMFSGADRVRLVPGLSYRHESHQVTIRSSDELRTTAAGSGTGVGECADMALMERLSNFLSSLDFLGAEKLLLDALIQRPTSSYIRQKLALIARVLDRRRIAAKLELTSSLSPAELTHEVLVGDSVIDATSSTEEFYSAYFSSSLSKNVIQVGANDGVMCDPLRPFLESGTRSDVNATLIEPVPFYFDKLRGLYGDRGWVTLLNAACGADSGSLPLYFIAPDVADEMNGTGPANDWAHGQGSFDRDTVIFWIDQNKFRGDDYVANIQRFYDAVRSIDVQVTPLRNVAASMNNENLLIVIDAQGHEMDVMRGIDWSHAPAFIVFEDDLKRETSLIDCFLQLQGFAFLCGENDKVYRRVSGERP